MDPHEPHRIALASLDNLRMNEGDGEYHERWILGELPEALTWLHDKDEE